MNKLAIIAVFAGGMAFADSPWPFITIRHTDVSSAAEKFEELVAVNARHPGSADEFWLCFRGGPTVKKTVERLSLHKRFLEPMKRAGLVVGSQQGVTLGHGRIDVAKGLFPDDAWQVERHGTRLQRLCPRSPFVLDYEADLVEAAVRTLDLESVWLDDDLRLGNGDGSEGCFCDRCIAAFNAEYGLSLTREELVRRLDAKTPKEELREKWRLFKNKTLAEFAAAARRGADRVKPSVRLAYQSVDAFWLTAGENYIPLMEALAGGKGRQSAIRVGSGNYFESMPGNYTKSLSVAREAERCHRSPAVAQVSYEQETYTREVLHKSAEAAMIESAMALAAGADALTEYWWVPGRDEPTSYYEEFMATIAEWRPFLEKLASVSKRTSLGGIARFRGSDCLKAAANNLRSPTDALFGSIGIPVTVAEAQQDLWYVDAVTMAEWGPGDAETIGRSGALVDAAVWDGFLAQGGAPVAKAVSEGRIVKFDFKLAGLHDRVTLPTHAERVSLLDAIDRVRRAPVRIERSHPFHVYPRVAADGRVAAVTLVNASIGKCFPTEIKVRGAAAGTARWYRPGAAPVELEARKTGDETAVTIPVLPGSQVGSLVFEFSRSAP